MHTYVRNTDQWYFQTDWIKTYKREREKERRKSHAIAAVHRQSLYTLYSEHITHIHACSLVWSPVFPFSVPLNIDIGKSDTQELTACKQNWPRLLSYSLSTCKKTNIACIITGTMCVCFMFCLFVAVCSRFVQVLGSLSDLTLFCVGWFIFFVAVVVSNGFWAQNQCYLCAIRTSKIYKLFSVCAIVGSAGAAAGAWLTFFYFTVDGP